MNNYITNVSQVCFQYTFAGCQRFSVACRDVANTCEVVGRGAFRVVSAFNRSLIGRTINRSIGENICESVGYTGGQLISRCTIEPIIGRASGTAAGFMGYAALNGILSGGVISTIIVSFRFFPFTRSDYSRVILTLSTTIVLFNLLYQSLEQGVIDRSTQLGMWMGEQSCSFTVGILTAYLSIFLFGSEERLIQWNNFQRTYVFKTLISMTICSLFESYCSLSPHCFLLKLSNFLLCQAIGSLAFNYLDIRDMARQIANGRALDRVLPDHLNFHLVDAFCNLTPEQLLNAIPRQKAVVDDFLHVLIPHFFQALQARIQQNPALQPIENLTDQVIFSLLVRGTNLYFNMRMQHPEIFENFQQSVRRIDQGLDIVNANIPHLHQREIDQVMQCMSNISDAMDTIDCTFRQFQNKGACLIRVEEMSFMLSQISEIRQKIRSGRLTTGSPVEVVNHRLQLRRCFLTDPLLSPETRSHLAVHLFDLIKRMETEVFMIPLSGDRQGQILNEMFCEHLPWIERTVLLKSLEVVVPLSDEETREFYRHFVGLFATYCKSIFGSCFTEILSPFLEHQVRHSELDRGV